MRTPRTIPMREYSILTLLLAFCIIGVIWRSHLRTSDALWYAHALSSARTNVSIAGARYEVRDGRIIKDGTPLSGAAALPALALAYEWTVAQRSPLLSLAGADSGALDTALDALEETADELAGRQAGPASATAVKRALYPVRFLRAAAAAEDARRKFIESGLRADALAYEHAVSAAISAYLSDLAAFRRAFEESVPEDMDKYQTERYIIGRGDVLAALDALRAGMLRTQREHRDRLACFRGAASRCDAKDIELSLLPVPEMRAFLPPAMLAVAGLIRETDREADARLVKQGEPLYALASSACIGTQPGDVPYLYMMRSMPALFALPTSTAPYYGGDIRFIESDRYRALPYIGFFAERGMAYVLSRPWTYYDCQTPDDDIGTVSALSAIRAFALSTPISAYASGNDAAALRALERTLRTGVVVYQADAYRYINAAAGLATKGALPESLARPVFDLLLEARTRSAATYQAVLEVARGEQVTMRLHDETGVPIDFSALYLFFTRSGFPSFFMASNPSAVGDIGPLFPLLSSSRAETPYVYYSEASGGERAEMERDMASYVRLHLFP